MKLILHKNVKMPTIVGILTFISRINTEPESFKARKITIFQHFSFYEQLKFMLSLVELVKCYIISGSGLGCLAFWKKSHFLWLFVGSNQLAVPGSGGFIVFGRFFCMWGAPERLKRQWSQFKTSQRWGPQLK